MRQRISWKLYDNDTLLLEREDVYCDYIDNDKIVYIDDFGTHTINLRNEEYQKVSDGTMIIKFKENMCHFTFENKEKFETKIECKFLANDNKIIMEYSFGEEIKRIEIERKE